MRVASSFVASCRNTKVAKGLEGKKGTACSQSLLALRVKCTNQHGASRGKLLLIAEQQLQQVMSKVQQHGKCRHKRNQTQRASWIGARFTIKSKYST